MGCFFYEFIYRNDFINSLFKFSCEIYTLFPFNWSLSKEWGLTYSLSLDDEVDINRGVNLEGGDILDNRWWAEDVDDSLVDSHLESVPGVSSLTAWWLSSGNSEDLSWDSDWSSNFITSILCSGNDFTASPLKRLGFSSLKGHSSSKLNSEIIESAPTWSFEAPLGCLPCPSCPSQCPYLI